MYVVDWELLTEVEIFEDSESAADSGSRSIFSGGSSVLEEELLTQKAGCWKFHFQHPMSYLEATYLPTYLCANVEVSWSFISR